MIYNIDIIAAAKKVSFGGVDVRFYEKDLPPSSEPWKPCLVLNLDMMDWDVDMVDVRVRKVIRYCFYFILNAFKTHILFHYIFLGRPSR